MARIVVLGAGLGGVVVAFELREKLGREHEITVVGKGDRFSFVPSNPWVAVGWRTRDAVEVELGPVFKRAGIAFVSAGASRVEPAENRIALEDGGSLDYDHLVLATGPELAFDEIEGLGPGGHTASICQTDHAEAAKAAFDKLVAAPGPVVIGAAQGASCFGPAYEFAFILDKALRDAKVRDRVPMTFVTPEPYIGHLGLDGVGDTKGLMESELRQRHIKWLTNTRIDRVVASEMTVSEIGADGQPTASHNLPFSYSMILPAFRGVAATRGIEGLTNPRGFIMIDQHQQNPAFANIFALGVCVAIPPTGKTNVPVGVPKTGFMIESMATAITHNIEAVLAGRKPHARASWNAVCLADFGDGGVAFVAQPQIPPRNVNWSSSGKWVHAAKVAFEKYFLHKVRSGRSEPFYERMALQVLGIDKLREVKFD